MLIAWDQNNCGLFPSWVRVVKMELFCFYRRKRLRNKLQWQLKLSSFHLKRQTDIFDLVFLTQTQNSMDQRLKRTSHHIWHTPDAGRLRTTYDTFQLCCIKSLDAAAAGVCLRMGQKGAPWVDSNKTNREHFFLGKVLLTKGVLYWGSQEGPAEKDTALRNLRTE